MLQGAEAEWAKVDPPHTLLRQPSLKLKRQSFGAVGPQGKQHPYRLIAQPTNGEFEREKGRRIEPLKVVNRNDQTPIVRRIPQRAENRERDRRLVGGATVRLGAKQRRLERLALRRRKLREAVFEHRLEKIGDACIRQVRFGFGGPRR
jgi:hypothetical protein